MTATLKYLCTAAIGAGILAFSTAGASAAIACSGNVCWHVHRHYHYPPDAAVVIHPDHWHWGPKVVIHEHNGAGYWHDGHWVVIH
jgi:hypothetical protein